MSGAQTATDSDYALRRLLKWSDMIQLFGLNNQAPLGILQGAELRVEFLPIGERRGKGGGVRANSFRVLPPEMSESPGIILAWPQLCPAKLD